MKTPIYKGKPMATSLSEHIPQNGARIESLQGLSTSEVRERRANGQGNNAKLQTSRSSLQILRENVFTTVNTLLFVLGIVLILLGQTSDAVVSVSVVFINVLVGVVQELRAKRALDRIALLTRPQVAAIRAGREQLIDPGDIVAGDLLVVRAGDQIVVDGWYGDWSVRPGRSGKWTAHAALRLLS
jgi:cation-transporting ATPase E